MILTPIDLDPRAYWDGQLKFSQILPGFQDDLARMARESAEISSQRTFTRRPTGPDPRQWVEWTTGHGADDILPVIVHGGYWRALRAENHRFLVPAFAHVGPAVALVEYRLKPAHSMAHCVADTVAGLQTVAAAFPEHRLLVIGHSAGAHLSLHAAREPRCRDVIAGIIALSGVYDLRPVAASSLQDEIGLTEEEISTFSLHPSEACVPTLFVNGGDETHELIRGSCVMAASHRCSVMLLPDANHMTLTWAAAAAARILISAWKAL